MRLTSMFDARHGDIKLSLFRTCDMANFNQMSALKKVLVMT